MLSIVRVDIVMVMVMAMVTVAADEVIQNTSYTVHPTSFINIPPNYTQPQRDHLRTSKHIQQQHHKQRTAPPYIYHRETATKHQHPHHQMN